MPVMPVPPQAPPPTGRGGSFHGAGARRVVAGGGGSGGSAAGSVSGGGSASSLGGSATPDSGDGQSPAGSSDSERHAQAEPAKVQRQGSHPSSSGSDRPVTHGTKVRPRVSDEGESGSSRGSSAQGTLPAHDAHKGIKLDKLSKETSAGSKRLQDISGGDLTFTVGRAGSQGGGSSRGQGSETGSGGARGRGSETGSGDAPDEASVWDMDPARLAGENEQLRRQVASFERQHRTMMGTLDREYHDALGQRDKDRDVLRREMADILRQLHTSELACRAKVAEAGVVAEAEKARAAAAVGKQALADQQRNALVAQVAKLRAELGERDSAAHFDDLQELAGQAGIVEARARPATAGGKVAAPAGGAAVGGAGRMLTREQLGQLRVHVQALAGEKGVLQARLEEVGARAERAEEKARETERLEADLAVAVSEREEALALATRVLGGLYGEYGDAGAPLSSAGAQAARLQDSKREVAVWGEVDATKMAALEKRKEAAEEAVARLVKAKEEVEEEVEKLTDENRALLERVGSLIHAAAQGAEAEEERVAEDESAALESEALRAENSAMEEHTDVLHLRCATLAGAVAVLWHTLQGIAGDVGTEQLGDLQSLGGVEEGLLQTLVVSRVPGSFQRLDASEKRQLSGGAGGDVPGEHAWVTSVRWKAQAVRVQARASVEATRGHSAVSSAGGADGGRTESGASSYGRTQSLEHVDVRRLQVQKQRLEKVLKESDRRHVDACAGYAAELAAMGDAVAAEAEEGLSLAAQLSAERAEAGVLQIEAGALRADAGVMQAQSDRSSELLAQGVQVLWNALQGIAADAGTEALCDLQDLGGAEVARFRQQPVRRQLEDSPVGEHGWVTSVRRQAEGVRVQARALVHATRRVSTASSAGFSRMESGVSGGSGGSGVSRTQSLEHVDVRRLQVQRRRLEKALRESDREHEQRRAGYEAEVAAMGEAVASAAEEGLSLAAQLSLERAEVHAEQRAIETGRDALVTQWQRLEAERDALGAERARFDAAMAAGVMAGGRSSGLSHDSSLAGYRAGGAFSGSPYQAGFEGPSPGMLSTAHTETSPGLVGGYPPSFLRPSSAVVRGGAAAAGSKMRPVSASSRIGVGGRGAA
ncbi:hypothetical protein T484DRAFT_1894444, partial [Baffinella frigidus]